jgi:hypothetical protein
VKLSLFINASALALLAAASGLQGRHASAVALALCCLVNVAAGAMWNRRRPG